MPFIINTDNPKQNLNLNAGTWRCLENDTLCFSSGKKRITLNGLINTVIINFWESALSSIDLRLEEAEENYQKMLEEDSFKSKKDRNAVMNYLYEAKRRELISRVEFRFKGIHRNFTLQQKVCKILAEECNEEGYYNHRPGAYLHALLEEYAALAYGEREKIFFKDIIDTAEDAAFQGKKIRVSTQNDVFEMRPYCVTRDDRTGYNYLVGYSARISGGSEQAASFRISQIAELKKLSRSDGPLSLKERNRIEDHIAQRGAAHILTPLKKITVILSSNGERKYALKQTDRPDYTERKALPDGRAEYIFICPEFQAKNYFLAFGKDAVIVSPRKLALEIASEFRAALENYADTI